MTELRADLALIADLIPPGSRVLDLGCSTGMLLRSLMSTQGCTGTGVDTDLEALTVAVRAGVPVIELDMDSELEEFATSSYDVVVLSRTLQVLLHPHRVLAEMVRIAPRVILSMPNFGYWRHRWRLATGHMPMSKDMPYDWYDTPNLHHATLISLEGLFDEMGLRIEQRIALTTKGTRIRLPERTANWSAGSAVYVLTKPTS